MRRFILSAAIIAFVTLTVHTTALCAEPGDGAIVSPFHAYSHEDMVRDAETLRKTYPELISLDSIGKSVEGRDLLLIRLETGGRSIFIDGTIHANEYICTSYLMYMTEQYAKAYRAGGAFHDFNVRDSLSRVTFCIVPMVNPDGVKLVQNGLKSALDRKTVSDIAENDPQFSGYDRWKANIRGVDLNRNFDNNWNVRRPVTAPAARLFKGTAPLSEPETRAIKSYVDGHMCWAFVNFHTQGGGLYGWDDPNIGYYPQLGSMASRILSSTGFIKLTDTPETDYGTFAGYARETFLKPTVTLELCRYIGSFPYPDADFMSVWSPAQDICLIVADEVLKMDAQEYLVFQSGRFLQAFCDEFYASRFAATLGNAAVVIVKGGVEALPSCTPSKSTLSLDGRRLLVSAYDIGGKSFIRLRDLAMALSGTAKQIEVGYDGTSNSITLTTGRPYTPAGGELSGTAGEAQALPSQAQLYLDGKPLGLTAYTIGGNNYFELSGLCLALGVGVRTDAAANAVWLDTHIRST